MTYTDAARYARKVIKNDFNYRDILHDAFIYYYDKTGGNLLNEHPGYILRLIKWKANQMVFKPNTYLFNGETHKKVWVDTDHLQSYFSPIQYVETKEFYEELYNKLLAYETKVYGTYGSRKSHINSEFLINLVNLLDQGYSWPEICKILNKSNQAVHEYKKKLQALISSPFAANPLKCKKITRKEYDAHPEKYEEYEYNTDRNADLNESYLQLVHKTEDHGLLIVEGKRLDL